MATTATLRPGEKPPLPQVVVHPPGASIFIQRLAAHAPHLESTLVDRSRAALRNLDPSVKAGLRTALGNLQRAITDTLADLA